jgi:hypothetical protein
MRLENSVNNSGAWSHNGYIEFSARDKVLSLEHFDDIWSYWDGFTEFRVRASILNVVGDIALTGTFSKITMSGNQAIVSGSDGLYFYTYYLAGGDSYLKIKDDGAVFIVVDGVIKHSFYASDTKSGGSIIIAGKNLGMSPIDSPQILLEYVEFDAPLTTGGTTVFIEERFRKAIENFAVFPNNGQVIKKKDGYFVIVGEGTEDVRIIGKRIGHSVISSRI